MAEVIAQALRQLELPWLTIGLLVLWLVSRSGVVSWIFRGAEKRGRDRVTDREQLSEDQRDLITELREAAEREHAWRISDASYYQGQIRLLRDENSHLGKSVSKLVETATSSERGNSRLRHGLNNAFSYIASLRHEFRKIGHQPPGYDGWRDMLGLTDDLDENLKRLFEDETE